jgi:antitoxin (DNA-binding transcriptional repressor) of toxin-antitoxin stability system
MKTAPKVITAKEFQRNRPDILKAVKAGQSFQVTFHRRPVANVTPVAKAISKAPKRGSHEAFLESLKYTAPSNVIPPDADLDELRWQHMQEKYGKYDK